MSVADEILRVAWYTARYLLVSAFAGLVIGTTISIFSGALIDASRMEIIWYSIMLYAGTWMAVSYLIVGIEFVVWACDAYVTAPTGKRRAR